MAAAAAGAPLDLDLRVENARLRRELDQLREQVLAASASKKSVAGGGFRGSMLRGSDKKSGASSAAAEVEALRQLVHQKALRVARMEQELAALHAEGDSQERTLNEMQRCLMDVTQEMSAKGTQKQALERAVGVLGSQLDGEKRRLGEVQRCATEAAATNEELSGNVAALRAMLEEQRGTLGDERGRAAQLEAELRGELRGARARAAELESQEVEARNHRRRNCEEQSELRQQLLVASTLRRTVLQLCWEAWAQQAGLQRLEQELAALRQQAGQEAERAALRSAEGRGAREEALAAAERASLKSAEGREARAQVRSLGLEILQLQQVLSLAEQDAASVREDAGQQRLHLEHQVDELREGRAEEANVVGRLRDELLQEEARWSAHSGEAAELGRAREALAAELAALREGRGAAEARARSQAEELEARLGRAEAAAAAARRRQAALEAEAADLERRAEGLEGCAERATELERRLRELEAAAAAAAAAAPSELERLKRIQREETLLKEVRRLEQERDDARDHLRRAQAAAAAAAPKKAAAGLRPEPPATRQPSQEALAEAEAAAAKTRVQLQALQAEFAAEQSNAEASRAELEASRRERDRQQAQAAAAGDLRQELEEVRGDAARQAERLRGEMLELRTDLSLERGEVKKLRLLREEHEVALKNAKGVSSSLEEAREEAGKWREAALEAANQIRGGVRILVTAPKVSINVGKNEVSVAKSISRDIEQIRGALGERVLPGFQRIMSVAEDQGEDDVRGCVLKLVEELAMAVQQEIYRVLPQAEGTASWDGFGARLTSLR